MRYASNVVCLGMSGELKPNRLIREKSPYLLQHAHNPVDWFSWGEEAFAKAREENRPIFLSIGYSTCHWCHVMEHESFENPDIAQILNQHFVSIKVDREERPDIDRVYMLFVQSATGSGGWPMSVWLTPEGKPFYGGTYYPPDDRYGRPGFPTVLAAVTDAWQNKRAEIEEQAGSIASSIRDSDMLELDAAPITAEHFDQAYQKLQQSFDRRFGGFGGAPK